MTGSGIRLDRLDAALAREIRRLRTRYQLTLDEFRGLYVSDEQVDALLADGSGALPEPLPACDPGPAVGRVMARFGLDTAAADVLLLALAPDIDPKYGTLIAYLNDDVRRRWPTVDLARRLFGAAVDLAPDGALFGPGLLVAVPNGEGRMALPLQAFACHPVLSAHLLGAAVAGAPVFEPEGVPEAAGALAGLHAAVSAGGPVLAILTGTDGGRAEAVRGLAARLGRRVIRAAPVDQPTFREAALAARLEHALLLIKPDAACLAALAPTLADIPVPVFLLPPPGEAWRPALAGCAGARIDFPPPDYRTRQTLWAAALRRGGVTAEDAAVAEVAERFRLSVRQIDAAAATLALTGGACDTAALIDAARTQASADLGSLAQRVTAQFGWPDLVLPPACLRQLRQFAAAIRHRERVFTGWGLSGGPGLTALFGGGPGTGKTMSAGVLAREAGLDLWRIDLSAVVSKYIGETEKHLDRIFAQARDGNAILFFDEADAMFGKRSEVKDAHDRYANIEVAYLLQRLESYDGVVILATNLARNIDPAFGRRLHFVIDFPLPDAALRERLWRAALPAGAPLAPDLDLGFVGRQFAFAGGDIRVAALDAAFAAAANDGPIDMVRLLQAVGRQLLKQGKVPQGSDFREYRALLAEAEAVRPVAAQ